MGATFMADTMAIVNPAATSGRSLLFAKPFHAATPAPMMKILFLHGWTSVPGGRKPTYLEEHGHQVINPALPDDDFNTAVDIAQRAYDEHVPDVVVGSSRGGAIALEIRTQATPLVLLCPAVHIWGSRKTVKAQTVVLHSRQDTIVPFETSQALIASSGLPLSRLVEVGHDHRLADEDSLAAMLQACQTLVAEAKPVDVTIYYLELRTAPTNKPPVAPAKASVLTVDRPPARYYRYLYDLVGSDYHWTGRRRLSDQALTSLLHHPEHALHVLHVAGTPAGFAELDQRCHDQIELVQFGLGPAFLGQGLGKWFLDWTYRKVWESAPQRLWLHTCTLDHPAALPNYRQAGFVVYHQETTQRLI